MSTKIKDALAAYVGDAVEGKTLKNPDKKHNVGSLLYEVYVWQELSALADKRLKLAWESAIDEGIVKDDDHYRDTPGETIAAESPSFSVVMKVSEPRKTIDKEKFLDLMAKKARIARPAMDDLWDSCLKEGKASLSKKVLEV